jgi:hypothetical protein
MRPNLTYFDVTDGFNAGRASGEDDAGIGLPGALKISFELSIGQWVMEKGRTPLNEVGLGRQPRDQTREVLATKGTESDAICWCALANHRTMSERSRARLLGGPLPYRRGLARRPS